LFLLCHELLHAPLGDLQQFPEKERESYTLPRQRQNIKGIPFDVKGAAPPSCSRALAV